MLAGNEVADVLQRSRPVEGIHSNNVLKAVGMEADQDIANPARLELEDAVRLSPLEKPQGCRIIVRDLGR